MKSFSLNKSKTTLLRFWTALWTVGLAFLATLVLSPIMALRMSPLFLLAIMFSSWRGGLAVGLFATALSALTSALVFLPPTFSLRIYRNDFYELVVFSVAAVIIGSLSAARKRAEEKQEQLLVQTQSARIEAEQANSVKDEFLATVSHELRTPLTTIKTLTRLMQRRRLSEEERQEYLADIASECDRQIDLVLNLLDLTRIKSGRLEIESELINVAEVIKVCEKIERLTAEEREQNFFVKIAPDLHEIRADKNALRRALCTIIENAVKFTAKGGSITLRAFNENQNIVIEVEDNGCGIKSADLPFIFDKFYRSRTDLQKINAGEEQKDTATGIGLGLHLAQTLIGGMSGTIEVVSEPGRGSKFTVRLPIWRERKNSDENLFGNLSPAAAEIPESKQSLSIN